MFSGNHICMHHGLYTSIFLFYGVLCKIIPIMQSMKDITDFSDSHPQYGVTQQSVLDWTKDRDLKTF